MTAGPEQLALVRDEASRAMALIRTLPTQQQEILTLRVAVGMSTEETAAALGMTAGAIRVAQHRALTGCAKCSPTPKGWRHEADPAERHARRRPAPGPVGARLDADDELGSMLLAVAHRADTPIPGGHRWPVGSARTAA